MNSLANHSISVVIPMHNEADNVQPFISEVRDNLHEKINFEIVVVDDGSKDATLTNLQKLRLAVPELKIVHHCRNYGQSASVVSGVLAASHEWVITLDGDGQNHPGDILNLINLLREQIHKTPGQAILIAGNRPARNDNWIRKLSTKIANGIRKRILKDNCPDSGCGVKAFRRSDFLRIPHFDHLHRFLPALFKRAGGIVINTPVQHRSRTRGYSKYGISNRLWVGIVDLIGVFWLIRRPCIPEIDKDVG